MNTIIRFFRPQHAGNEANTRDTKDASLHSIEGNHPKITLLEFFQSQSCDSCPPANETLINLVSTPDADTSYLLLTYHVTYWNHLSWRDTFSYQAFDGRQREYMRKRKNPQGLYTPMLIVNGRSIGVGNTKEAVSKLIREGQGSTNPIGDKATPSRGRVYLSVETNQYGEKVVTVDATAVSSETGDGDLHVLVIRYLRSPADVLVTRGENAGRTLRHRNVVTGVTRIGYLQRECFKPYILPPNEKVGTEGRVVVVQDGAGGEIMDVVVV
ncbi:hypothetical protein LTR84_003270 [Exophiala bonariae]|uniref:DUF1223 domain-containing protein n=1 Tax=Exophiala bonariae TaxID=1690606 RepID=A0AAV9N869_9EURO|nr:hypothetical protein LTR84_003270 [Exophiala bonariae]